MTRPTSVWRSRVAAGVLGLCSTLSLISAVASASSQPEVATDMRILLVSLPGVTWADVSQEHTPEIARLAESGLRGNLSMRTYRSRPRPADAAATASAGTRSVGLTSGNALGINESLDEVAVTEVYQQRFGTPASDAAVVHLDAPRVIRQNRARAYRAHVGLLGTTVQAAGIQTGIVANADKDRDPTVRDRSAALAVMNGVGEIDCGRVDRGLLRDDSRAPFGFRFSEPAVIEAAVDCIGMPGQSTLTLLDASDLQRVVAYDQVATEAVQEEMRDQALARTDSLIANIIDRARPDRVMLMGWTPGTASRTLGLFAVAGAGIPEGTAISGTTRQPGYVAIEDVAPTILDWYGLESGEELDGRPVTHVDDDAGSLGALVAANERAQWYHATVATFLWGLIAFASAVALVAVSVPLDPRVRRVAGCAAVTLLLVLPISYLSVPTGIHELGTLVSVVLMFGLAAIMGILLWRYWSAWAASAALIVGIVIPTISLTFAHSAWQVASIFGNSPITGGRFSGSNNITFSFLIASAISLGAFARHRWGARADRWIALAFAALVMLQGAPFWGSDVGSIIAGIPVLILSWLLLTNRAVNWRRLNLSGLAVLGAAAIAIAIDLRRPVASRTHLGRLWEKTTAEGIDGLGTVIIRKWELNLRAFGWSPYWIFAFLALGVGVHWYLTRCRNRDSQEPTPYDSRFLAAMAIAAVLGTVLNDSGMAVPGALGLVLLGTLGSQAVSSDSASYNVRRTTDEERDD